MSIFSSFSGTTRRGTASSARWLTAGHTPSGSTGMARSSSGTFSPTSSPASCPRPVATTVRERGARNKDLAGFRPERTSQVERFNARKNEFTTYYEVFGHTPRNIHPRIEVDTSGKLLKVDTSFIPSLEDFARYEPLWPRGRPPAVVQGITTAAPEIRLTKVFRMTTRDVPGVRYEAFGRVDRGRSCPGLYGRRRDAARLVGEYPPQSGPKGRPRRRGPRDGHRQEARGLPARRGSIATRHHDRTKISTSSSATAGRRAARRPG